MASDILLWLNGKRNFQQGIDLLIQYGKSSDAEKLKLSNAADKARQLFFAVKSLLSPPAPRGTFPVQSTKAPKTIPEPIAAPAIIVSAPVTKEAIPEVAIEAKRGADRLYKRMSNLRAELFALCNLKEEPFENEGAHTARRGALTRQIMELQPLVDKAYDAYRFALLHGRMPEAVAAQPEHVDPMKLHQEITNLRKYISKAKNHKTWSKSKIDAVVKEKTALLNDLLTAYENATDQSQ